MRTKEYERRGAVEERGRRTGRREFGALSFIRDPLGLAFTATKILFFLHAHLNIVCSAPAGLAPTQGTRRQG